MCSACYRLHIEASFPRYPQAQASYVARFIELGPPRRTPPDVVGNHPNFVVLTGF